MHNFSDGQMRQLITYSFVLITLNSLGQGMKSEFGRLPTTEEQRQISVTFQSGIELLGWIVQLDNELTSETIVIRLKEATDKIQKNDIKLPLGDYHEYRDVAMSFSFVFGQAIVDEFNWAWRFVESDKKLGWHIFSPDNEYCIALEDYFYQRIMWDRKTQISCVDIFKNGGLKFLTQQIEK